MATKRYKRHKNITDEPIEVTNESLEELFASSGDEITVEEIDELQDMLLLDIEQGKVEEPRNIDFNPTKRQFDAYQLIFKPEIEEVVFGGGAGGSKTHLGCAVSIIIALEYRGARLLIGRESYTDLIQSTLVTFFEVCNQFGLVAGTDYIYNQQKATIIFKKTGSVILLKELRYYPKDPLFDRFGSFEFTFQFLDEAQQIREKAKQVLKTRLRWKLAEFGLTPTQLMTCNPSKGFLYTDFYKPWKENTLPPHRAFVQSLASDNPYIDPSYIANLEKADKNTQERLLYGNWEYDDDPATMIEYDAINDLFTNNVAELPHDETFKRSDMYMIIDVARKGKDKTVVKIFYKMQCIAIYTYAKNKIDTLAEDVKKLEQRYKVPRSHVAVDEGGVGGGLVDLLRGCVGFISQAPAFDKGYENLKTQCQYKLADIVNDRKMGVTCTDPEIRDQIIKELEVLKIADMDSDKKFKTIPKKKMKALLGGESPDYLDTLTMRMVFEVRPAVTLDF